MKRTLPTGGLVYSTDSGRMCPDCRQPIAQCLCKINEAAKANKAEVAASDGVVRVSRETKGRAGKGVTVVKGLDLDAAALAQLGKQLRAACGAGGTTKDGTIEIQGDHCERVIEMLRSQGRTVKRAGG